MKNKIKNTILFLVFASGLFFALSGGMQAAPNCSATPGFVLDPSGVCVPSTTGLPDPAGSDPVATILINVMQWLLGIFGVAAIIAFIISGLQYIMSTGEQTAMEKAKRNMLYSIIGVAVGLAGLLIVMAINSMLAGSTTF
ncbi:MAG: pilin [Candidatus Moranbacteria bacterium]|jgi:hypothetical protein|nr:pilin [Candidatus Moranbacteria bacterium]